MAVVARRLEAVDGVFGIEAASRVLIEALPSWMQELGLLVEAVEAGRPAGAPPDWQPGAIIRLPFSLKIARGGILCSQALMAAADTAMALACAAVWNGQRASSPIDQTIHFLRPVNFDVLAGRPHRPNRPQHGVRPSVADKRGRSPAGRDGVERPRHVVAVLPKEGIGRAGSLRLPAFFVPDAWPLRACPDFCDFCLLH